MFMSGSKHGKGACAGHDRHTRGLIASESSWNLSESIIGSIDTNFAVLEAAMRLLSIGFAPLSLVLKVELSAVDINSNQPVSKHNTTRW